NGGFPGFVRAFADDHANLADAREMAVERRDPELDRAARTLHADEPAMMPDQTRRQVGDLSAPAFFTLAPHAAVSGGHAEPGESSLFTGFDDLRAQIE